MSALPFALYARAAIIRIVESFIIAAAAAACWHVELTLRNLLSREALVVECLRGLEHLVICPKVADVVSPSSKQRDFDCTHIPYSCSKRLFERSSLGNASSASLANGTEPLAASASAVEQGCKHSQAVRRASDQLGSDRECGIHVGAAQSRALRCASDQLDRGCYCDSSRKSCESSDCNDEPCLASRDVRTRCSSSSEDARSGHCSLISPIHAPPLRRF
ncbi:hypothetical protein IE81DRAFT_191607 [Ceraceosorus guamensis]|uniref:Uncharacterized protein n=1 Tax=Ceraceosorus guamensis TaxID=1522189 RepID=A0A316W6E0_9BASI|nr:hypothetical protein IE81DRAFT_191607 [Ceraceosorus guamensis]PWN45457.1 hypothetical protein IE81DRAFT_191607 [Ceraceosorus guamensis]